jgi:hypothetical protein
MYDTILGMLNGLYGHGVMAHAASLDETRDNKEIVQESNRAIEQTTAAILALLKKPIDKDK